MMSKTDLTWDMLKTSLNALTRASESDHKLSKAAAAADVTVKQEPREVAVVYERRSRGSSSERSYNRNYRGYEARSPRRDKGDDTTGKPVGMIWGVAKKEDTLQDLLLQRKDEVMLRISEAEALTG